MFNKTKRKIYFSCEKWREGRRLYEGEAQITDAEFFSESESRSVMSNSLRRQLLYLNYLIIQLSNITKKKTSSSLTTLQFKSRVYSHPFYSGRTMTASAYSVQRNESYVTCKVRLSEATHPSCGPPATLIFGSPLLETQMKHSKKHKLHGEVTGQWTELGTELHQLSPETCD